MKQCSDLFFNFYGNYTRQRDIFNSAVKFNNGAIGPTAYPPGNIPIVVNPFGTTPGVNPIPFNQFALGGSVTKTFGQAFATLGASGYYILYDHSVDNIPVPFQTSLDGGNVWVTGRLRYISSLALCVWRRRWRFSNVSTIHCLTRTDTESLGALERMTQTV